MKKTIALLLISLSFSVFASTTPQSLEGHLTNLDQVPVLELQALDRHALMAEDAARDGPGVAPRFAIPHPVSITPEQHGLWETTKDGRQVWRLVIRADQARSLNLGFTRFHLPENAHVQIFGQEGKYIVRPFTAADNHPQRELWTPVIPGDHVVIELVAESLVIPAIELELSSINYGYRGFFEPAAERSGSCNVDVVCPEGEGWEEQIASVAVISTGGGTFCTGFMVNNAENDDTPFFMTANHCGIGSGNAPSLVAYWNFHNSYCRIPNTGDSGGVGDGTLDQFTTGAIHRASYNSSDFTLVEFNNEPDESYGVFYAGWDVRDQATTSAIAVHHPSTNEKRISFENDPTSITSYLSNSPDPSATHIRVEDWDVGTTEPGSSGSPLFSPEGRVIGQLHGGFAACSNNDPDWYGRMYVSWDRSGSNSGNRLRDWLDPQNTGVDYIDGKPQGDLDPTFEISADPALVSTCSGNPASVDVLVRSRWEFDDEVTLGVDGLVDGLTADFTANPVVPEDPALVVLLTLDNTGGASGLYNLTLTGDSSGPSFDPISLTAPLDLLVTANAPGAASITSPTNGASGIGTSPTIEWTALADATGYDLEIATDSGFSDIVYTTSTADTSHALTSSLSPATTYYTRVRGGNDCGDGDWSATINFTTANEICIAPNQPITDNDPAGINSDIVITETGIITGLEMTLDITHTWVGDLIINLTHVETGTSIELVNRANGANVTFGCSSENIQTGVSDDAPLSLQDDCVDGGVPVAYPEDAYSPNDPLADFIGGDAAGTWRLNVSDNASQDTGTLNAWCLLPGIGDSDTYSIGGMVSGLEGSGLVLQNNGGDDLTILANGSFEFDTELLDGEDYDVSVAVQPSAPAQVCQVINGSGTVDGEDVTDVEVVCELAEFSIGGTVSGLEGSGLVLQNNGGDDLAILANGSFEFATQLTDGESYAVTVANQPGAPAQTCNVNNASGTVNAADVSDIEVVCEDQLTTLTGLISSLGYCQEDPSALGGALVAVDGQNQAYSMATGGNGLYEFQLPVDESPISITVSHSNHRSTGLSGLELDEELIEQDFGLVLRESCARTDQESVGFSLVSGSQSQQELVLSNALGGIDLSWSLDTDPGCYAPGEPGWLDLSHTGGLIAWSNQRVITLSVDTTGLAEGPHSTNLCFATSDPDNPAIEVEVLLEVLGPLLFHDRFEAPPEN